MPKHKSSTATVSFKATSNHGHKISLMAVCVHEAAHAFMRVQYRLPFTHISVIPDEDRGSGGHVLSAIKGLDQRLNDRKGHQLADRLIRAALAGEVAQLKYERRSFKLLHSSHDWQNALSYASGQSGSYEEALAWCTLIYIQVKNELNLDHNWNAVRALARELKARGKLSARHARAILRSALTL